MDKLSKNLKRSDLLCIKAMKSELGYNTERKKLFTLTDCEDWLRDDTSNSIKLLFTDGTVLNFKN